MRMTTKVAVVLRGGQTYQQRIMGTGPIAYWPLSETSGTTANCLVNPAQNGSYVSVVPGSGTGPDGQPCPVFDGTDDGVNIYSAALASAFNGDEGSLGIWAQVSAAGVWTDSTYRYLVHLYADAQNLIRIIRHTTDYFIDGNRHANNVDLDGLAYQNSLNWRRYLITWSRTADLSTIYVNGTLIKSLTGLGAWVGSLHANVCAIGALRATAPVSAVWSGGLAHCALWNRPLTAAEAASDYDWMYGTNGIFAIGDSKTGGDSWVNLLEGNLEVASGVRWSERPTRYGISGATVASMKTYIDSNLASVTQRPTVALINLGVNDVAALPAEATWKANLTSIIDSLRAKWSGVLVYVAKPWTSGEDADCATLAGWIDAVIATYPSGVAVGPNENVWLENGDDGATYTSDGTHYNAAAEIECAAQWQTALGY